LREPHVPAPAEGADLANPARWRQIAAPGAAEQQYAADEQLALRCDFDGEAYLTGLAEFLPR